MHAALYDNFVIAISVHCKSPIGGWHKLNIKPKPLYTTHLKVSIGTLVNAQVLARALLLAFVPFCFHIYV